MIFSLLASILSNILSLIAGGQSAAAQIVVLIIVLGVIAFTMVSIFNLAKELYNSGIGVLCAVLMIVPCLALIVLLIVNQKATTLLQSNGVRVGFLGTHPDKV